MRRALPCRFPSWVLLVAGFVVALLLGVAIVAIVDTSRKSTEAQLRLVPLQEHVYREAANERSTLDSTLPSAARATLLEARRQELRAAVTALDNRGMDPAELAQLRAAVAEFERAVDMAALAVDAGQPPATQDDALRQVDLRLAAVESMVLRENAQASASVTRDERLMELAIIGTVVLAVLATTGLFWFWARARTRLESRLVHQANHDPLTGLANRAYFVTRLEEALRDAQHDGGRTRVVWWPNTLVVLFLDLDGFKLINDSLGHAAGDRVLQVVAERLCGCVRQEDTVARLGGDEFTILLAHLVNEDWAIRAAERISQALATPISVTDRTVTITTSVGIVLARAEHRTGDELLRDADVAMYQAKQRGQGQYAVFAPEMQVGALARLDLEADLRRGVAHDEFVVHYQPEVELATGRVVGVEALVRWQHPRRGLLFPGDFIAVAEKTGLIIPLGCQILLTASRQVREWQAQGLSAQALGLSVNLSVRQLRHPDLVAEVARSLHQSGLAPGSLTLELTESILVEEPAEAIALLRQLKELGILLAIDDFGTGYSSLAYLKRLPVDTLKIDQSFVAGLGRDAADAGIVQAIVTLSSTLGLQVIAEGVETAEQRARLVAAGCSLGQGYYFAKPQSASEISLLLQAAQPLGLEAATPAVAS